MPATPARQKIVPFLWFDTQAEEAMNHYLSIFEGGEVLHVARWGDAGPGPAGTAMVCSFRIAGQAFTALNGGPQFRFTEAISMVVNCDSQAEIDRLWERLSDGGSPGQCGWLKDRYGLSWQIVPAVLPELMTGPDPAAPGRVMQSLMRMTKLDLAALQAAHRGD
jgi:predicted 3-demethylubiquinone-9 3-methyltransferase (glyoxalase superfamily)